MDNNKSIYALLLAAAVLVGGSIWFACSSDYESENDDSTLTGMYPIMTLTQARSQLQNLETIRVEDLFFMNNQRFSMIVTETDAKKLGVSDSIYKSALNMVDILNADIELAEQKAIQSGRVFAVIDCNPIEQETNKILMRLTANAEMYMPSGSLTTWQSNNCVTDSCFVVSGMDAITVHCTKHTNPLQDEYVHIVQVSTPSYCVRLYLRNKDGNILFNLSETLCKCYIDYSTTNAFGGDCSWTGLNTQN